MAQQDSRMDDLRAVFLKSKFTDKPGKIVYDLLGEGILGSAKWVYCLMINCLSVFITLS